MEEIDSMLSEYRLLVQARTNKLLDNNGTEKEFTALDMDKNSIRILKKVKEIIAK